MALSRRPHSFTGQALAAILLGLASAASPAAADGRWSFQPITRPAQPQVQRDDWILQPIDAFILARLEANGLAPASATSKATLLRRVFYGLTGLPPSPAQLRSFLADTSPDSYERLVDRLLASPRYGERWGRHWLDLMRFAETNSFENDRVKPGAWRYRDWVIEAFNSGMTYDEFVRQQIAGDELEPASFDRRVATTWYRLGPWDFDPTDRLTAQFDDLDGIVTTVGQVFLGLTVNCARCHDHKVDPISQKDYYSLLAFFRGLRPHVLVKQPGISWDDVTVEVPGPPTREKAELTGQESLAQIRGIEELIRLSRPQEERARIVTDAERREAVAKYGGQVLTKYQREVYGKLHKELDGATKSKPEPARMVCATENGPKPPATHVLLRGSVATPDEEVQPAFPAVLNPPEPPIQDPKPGASSSGRRRALAGWISSDGNLVAARVFVNRLWQHHFGRGLVRTPNNFGGLGRPPTHPALLDWLATEFVRSGWDIKRMHRLILTSNAYRMSSRPSRQVREKDPSGDLFSHFEMRRLSAEEIRDSIHAVNGSLNLKAGGPGYYSEMPLEFLRTQSRPGHGWGFSSEAERARRSVYIHVKRSLITPILQSFDFSDTDTSCPVRFATTQPTQALDTINGKFFGDQARVFAEFLRASGEDEAEGLVRLALERALQRDITPQDIERGVRFLSSMQAEHGASASEALEAYCLVVLNLNEFLYLD